jgi:hypothetical protein
MTLRVYRANTADWSMIQPRVDRGKTVAESLSFSRPGLPSSEKQTPQVVEIVGSGCKSREALETRAVLVRQAP